jgi:hypothetical protein
VSFWPAHWPLDNSLEGFEAALLSEGFEVSSDESVEAGWIKIALFGVGARPTHAARQLANGKWTSKLGAAEDIAHDLHDIEGPAYGGLLRIYRLATATGTRR